MHKHTITRVVAIVGACLLGAADLPARADQPDFSFTSTVKAKTLRVDVAGHPKVTFHGSQNRQTVFDSKRNGFPKPVVAGKTYNNVQINTKIESKFTDPEKGTDNANGANGSVDGGVGGNGSAGVGPGASPASGAGARAAAGGGRSAGRSAGAGNESGQNVQPEHRPQGNK